MTGFFISAATSSYYEGDQVHVLDAAVPQRPDATYRWDGAQWVIDAPKAAAATRLSADVQELADFLADPTITALVNQTKAQWQTWVTANLPTLTAAERTRLGILFWVVSIGVRRLMR